MFNVAIKTRFHRHCTIFTKAKDAPCSPTVDLEQLSFQMPRTIFQLVHRHMRFTRRKWSFLLF